MASATSNEDALPAQVVRKKDLLPPADELIRQRDTPGAGGRKPTLQEIGDRYGTSRQAVYKRIQKYLNTRSAAS